MLCVAFKTEVKGTTSRFARPENFSLNFSSLSFVIRVNLLRPLPSLFPFGLFMLLRCFSTLENYYLKVSSPAIKHKIQRPPNNSKYRDVAPLSLKTKHFKQNQRLSDVCPFVVEKAGEPRVQETNDS